MPGLNSIPWIVWVSLGSALISGLAAVGKNRSWWKWALLGAFFLWFTVLYILLAPKICPNCRMPLPPKKGEPCPHCFNSSLNQENIKTCPACSAVNPSGARFCTQCGKPMDGI
jgi:predicted amidophosphoribosyltransferase